MKLGMTLKETGVEELTDRLGVYLTNTLEEGLHFQGTLFDIGLAGAVSEESRLAAQIKSEHPVMVVMGNPPYSLVSSNETKFANGLIEKYKVEPGGLKKLQERKHWLNDDYVKFLAFAEDVIAKNGEGILAMITNNGYFDNPTFRGMRWQLSTTFDKIYLINLHGNAKKKEISPDGSKDENIFDIMQGVGIVLAVKTNKKNTKSALVYYADLFGKRSDKFIALENEINFENITLDSKSVYFVPKNIEGEQEYMSGVDINSLFKISSTGIFTLGDNFIVDDSQNVIEDRVKKIISGKYGLEELNNNFKLGKNYAKWITSHKNFNKFDEALLQRYTYRPFDDKYSYFDSRFIWRLREKITKNFFRENVAICIGRQGGTVGPMPWNVCFISKSMVDLNLFYRGGEQVYPLYIYHDDGTKSLNFNTSEFSTLLNLLNKEPDPDDVFNYIYAILHSPNYREKFDEFLKVDYPQIPIPTQPDFDRVVPLGRELRELHLMRSPIIDQYQTTFPVSGDCTVEKVSYTQERVWINKTQYFGNVPELAWNFYIGGYQPAQKWLKDRKGRQLSDADLVHYQRIIKILLETDRIMKEIG
jgi:predicted helicase